MIPLILKTLCNPLYKPQVVWNNEVYIFSEVNFPLFREMDNSRGRSVFSKKRLDLAALGEDFISCWHFLSMSFLLCKHEAVPKGHENYWLINTHRRTLNMNHSIFIWTCNSLKEKLTQSYLSITRPFLSHIHTHAQILTHTGEWERATPFPPRLVSLKLVILR